MPWPLGRGMFGAALALCSVEAGAVVPDEEHRTGGLAQVDRAPWPEDLTGLTFCHPLEPLPAGPFPCVYAINSVLLWPGAATTRPAAEIGRGELMTVVETAAACSARVILASRASS